MNEEQKSLIDKQNAGEALRELQLHHGWKELVKVLTDMYMQNAEVLLHHENVDARANIRAIENLSSAIKLKIGFGKLAAESLKTERFKTMPDTLE